MAIKLVRKKMDFPAPPQLPRQPMNKEQGETVIFLLYAIALTLIVIASLIVTNV